MVGIEPKPKILPAIADADSYVAKRVDDQIGGYYRKRAETYTIQLRRPQALEFVVPPAREAPALGVIAAATGDESIGAWVPVPVRPIRSERTIRRRTSHAAAAQHRGGRSTSLGSRRLTGHAD